MAAVVSGILKLVLLRCFSQNRPTRYLVRALVLAVVVVLVALVVVNNSNRDYPATDAPPAAEAAS